MRIALLCCDPALDVGDGRGCTIRLRSLAEGLARGGHTLAVVVAGRFHERMDGAHPLPGLELRPLRLPVTTREIDWHFSRVQPDLVIEHLSSSSIDGVRAAIEAGVRHVYDVTDPLDFAAPDRERMLEGVRAGLRLTSGVLAGSPAAARWVRSLAPAGLPVLQMPGAAPPEFLRAVEPAALAQVERRLRLQPSEFRIGFVGALQPTGNVLTLVRAVGEVARQRPTRLVIIGDGPLRNHLLYVALENGTPLTLCGRVPHPQMPAHLAACHAIAVPGDEDPERVPLSLYEAKAQARPIVAAASPGMSAVLRHEHDALLVPPGDESALSAALLRLASEPAFAARLGESARRTVEEGQTWDALAVDVAQFAQALGSKASDSCGR